LRELKEKAGLELWEATGPAGVEKKSSFLSEFILARNEYQGETNSPLANVDLDGILLKAERDYERQIAMAAIYRPVEVMRMMGDFMPMLDQSVVKFWKLLNSRKTELINAGKEAGSIASAMIDYDTFKDWVKYDRPNMVDGVDNVEIAIKRLKAYRRARICLVDIQDDLSERLGDLCLM
jgi:hypothetical protein